jgi:Na+/H+ antiporter NhaD/arsenite permease-like protein
VTGLFLCILVLMIAALALEEKLHARKSIIVGSFAGLCLILATLINILSFGEVLLPGSYDLAEHVVYEDAEHMPLPVYVPAIDWSVITIILGASLFVEVTSRSGVFTWMAIKLTKKSGGDPWRLLIAYGLLTVLFSAVLNNVTAMIIIGSLTTVSLKKLRRTDLLLGFLLVEGLLTNVGGLLTLISSVPNIIVGNTAKIGFVEFFLYASPYVVVATAATLFMAKSLFKIEGLKTDAEREEARRQVAGFNENESIPSDKFFWFSVGMLGAFILALSAQAVLPWGLDKLGMGFIALSRRGLVEIDRRPV